MSLLKKENWFACLIIMLFTQGAFGFVLAYMLKLYDKNAWYAKWPYWVFGTLCLIFPAFIMLLVFNIQMLVLSCKKLNVPGSEIYATPYSWIICLIIPVLGWILLLVMSIYLIIWPAIMIKRGEGEKYVA